MGKRSELLRWCKKIGVKFDQLEILVEDIKAQESIQINKNIERQIKFLLLKLKSSREIRKRIWHEMQILKRYGMIKQSKFVPDHNVSVKQHNKKHKHKHHHSHHHRH